MLIIFLSHIGVKAGDEQSLYICYKVYDNVARCDVFTPNQRFEIWIAGLKNAISG